MSYPTPGMRFQPAGEYRPPRQGEWFEGVVGPRLAERDFFGCRSILRRVDDGERTPEEQARENQVAEERLAAEQERRALRLTATRVIPMKQVADGYRLPYGDDEA